MDGFINQAYAVYTTSRGETNKITNGLGQTVGIFTVSDLPNNQQNGKEYKEVPINNRYMIIF